MTVCNCVHVQYIMWYVTLLLITYCGAAKDVNTHMLLEL